MKLACYLFAISLSLDAQSGSLTIHMMLHAIGYENYTLIPSAGGLTLNTKFEYSDRGNQRTTTAVLRMKPDYTPLSLEITPRPATVFVQDGTAKVTEDAVSRTLTPSARYFTIFGPSPFAVQMAMLRYWKGHAEPVSLPTLRADPAALPVRIELAGHDSITANGQTVALDRYTITNLVFGREILWMNA